MSKPVLGLVLGLVLGAIDGIIGAAIEPKVRSMMTEIAFYSAMKSMVVGLILGFFARKVKSLKAGLIFGGVLGLILAFLAAMQPTEGEHFWLQIIIPGTIVGVILGYVTQKHNEATKPSTVY